MTLAQDHPVKPAAQNDQTQLLARAERVAKQPIAISARAQRNTSTVTDNNDRQLAHVTRNQACNSTSARALVTRPPANVTAPTHLPL